MCNHSSSSVCDIIMHLFVCHIIVTSHVPPQLKASMNRESYDPNILNKARSVQTAFTTLAALVGRYIVHWYNMSTIQAFQPHTVAWTRLASSYCSDMAF